MTPVRSKAVRRDVSSDATSSSASVRNRTSNPEQPLTGYWSRLLKIVRAIIVELGKYSASGEYYVLLQNRAYGQGTEEPLIDPYKQTKAGIADPYGLIIRWKTRTDGNSPELLTANP